MAYAGYAENRCCYLQWPSFGMGVSVTTGSKTREEGRFPWLSIHNVDCGFWLRTILVLSLFLFPTICRAQGGASFDGQVVQANGGVAAYATVLVCPYTATGTPCTPTALLYSDLALSNPIPNPYSTDQYGNFTFFVESGVYILQVSVGGGIVYSYVATAGTCPGCVQLNPTGNQIITQPAGTSLTVNILNSSSGALNGTLGATTPNTAVVTTLNATTGVFSGNVSAPTLNATTGVFSGNVSAPTFTGNLAGNATTATAFAALPTGCSANLFATGYTNTQGDLQCNAITGAALPTPTASTLGGVFSSAAPTNEFATGINSSGSVTYAQLTATQIAVAGTLSNPTTGNAGTSTALAATPIQCAAPGQMTGIAANGNANCTSTITDDWNTFNGCAFATDGATINCTTPTAVTLTKTMPDTSYSVSCTHTYNQASDLDISLSVVISGKTTTGYTVNENSGNNSALSSQFLVNNYYDIVFTCHAYHN